MSFFFFFNDTATTEIYTLSLHDALPILLHRTSPIPIAAGEALYTAFDFNRLLERRAVDVVQPDLSLCGGDRKSTRLNSSHANISYAVFCLKKKNALTLL